MKLHNLARGIFVRIALFLSALFLFHAWAGDSSIELITKPLVPKALSGGDSGGVELSADGKWAVFLSNGSGLATNDNSQLSLDVFVRNLETGETSLISRNPQGASGAGDSYAAFISADARYVVFESNANDLTPDDQNDGADVFLYDANSRQVTRLTQKDGKGETGEAALGSITPDARFVVFESTANDLATDSNASADLFVFDRQSGATTLVSAAWNGTATGSSSSGYAASIGSFQSAISDDGRYIAFLSTATNLVRTNPGRLLNHSELYLRDRLNETNYLITPSTNLASGETLDSFSPVLSANGETLAFISTGHAAPLSTRLYFYRIGDKTLGQVPAPAPTTSGGFEELDLTANGQWLAYGFAGQIYLYDTVAGTNQLISASPQKTAGAGISGSPAISRDGRIIIFSSFATNLVEGLSGETYELFSFDREVQQLRLLSRNTSGTGGINGDALFPVLSADGQRAAFMSIATDVVSNDSPHFNDLFLVKTMAEEPASLISAGDPRLASSTADGDSRIDVNGLSLDGRYLIFTSTAADLTAGDTNDVTDLFLRDLKSGETRLISLTAAGEQRSGPLSSAAISANGRTIIFNALEPVNGANVLSLLAYDTQSRTTRVASVMPDGQYATSSVPATVSADGRYVAFVTTGTPLQLFVRDLEAQSTTFMTNLQSGQTALISPGGKYLIGYRPNANNSDVFIMERESKATRRLGFLFINPNPFSADDSAFLAVGRVTTTIDALYLFPSDTLVSNRLATNVVGAFSGAALSPDGSDVIFNRRAAGTTDMEVVVHDVSTGLENKIGEATNMRFRGNAGFSADGRFVVLAVTNQLGDASTQLFSDIYLYDRLLTNFTLVSRSMTGGEANAPSSVALISANGRTVVFDSFATDIVANDRNFASDIFVARVSVTDTNHNGLEDGWELQNLGGAADPSADLDGDGASNLQEFLAGTDPRSATSVFVLDSDVSANSLVLRWPALFGRSYQLQHRASLGTAAWSNVGNPVIATASGGLETEVSIVGSTGFYRIQLTE